jgi:phosphate transport system substrate-binding protein
MSRIKIYSLLCMVAVALVFGIQGIAAENLVIKGSTTVLPIAQAAGEAFMKKNPTINISISGGGSGDGIKALIDKTTAIANSSRDMKPEETKLAESRGIKPLARKIAIDAIVPIVHPSNPIRNISIEQLSLIYQGKITNWKELGGSNKSIAIISRDTSSGTYETWEDKVLHKARVTPRAQLQASNGAIVQVVSRNKYAIGYIGIGYLNKTVKGLDVNGVKATAENASSGQYPIARPLYMFTNGKPTGPAGQFIDFLLSSEGQKIVKQAGFVPIKKQ